MIIRILSNQRLQPHGLVHGGGMCISLSWRPIICALISLCLCSWHFIPWEITVVCFWVMVNTASLVAHCPVDFVTSMSLLSDPVAGGSSISTISMAVSMGEAKQGRYNRYFLCFAVWVFAVESIHHLGEDSPYWWLFWEENWYFACIPFDFGPH